MEAKRTRHKVIDLDKSYQTQAVKVIDEAILHECKIKLARPELLAPVLLQLAQAYHKLIEDDKLPV